MTQWKYLKFNMLKEYVEYDISKNTKLNFFNLILVSA